MPTKIIVSYDGTANEDDAVALGRVFAAAGAEVALAYVRHVPEADAAREELAQKEAHDVLGRGLGILGNENAQRHVVTDRSTPNGLAALAESTGANLIVFCSDSHTAKGHVAIGNSAERLLEGGRTAVAIAPVDLAERSGEQPIKQIVSVGDSEGGALATANALAKALGATVEPVINEHTDLLILDSRAETQEGRISISSSASHLIETAGCAVLVLPRGVRLDFGAPVGAHAA